MKLTDKIQVLNADCMQVMAKYPDKYFDLAVVDPPYGLDMANKINTVTGGKKHISKDWDKSTPDKSYFSELFRVSKNQIVWGGNYYITKILSDKSCWIIWDKNNGTSLFADAELAWTSFDSPTRIVKVHWCGSAAIHETGQNKIHPTQKPIKLYDWIFKNYAEQGMKILDTHGGSMSSVISADKAGLEMVCCELDKEYFYKAVDRFKKYKSQNVLEFK